jgi:hypothetical protein
MPGSSSQEMIERKTRVVAATFVALGLLGALILWVCLGWMIDFYVAETAADRFQVALSYGDRAAACMNAGIAAEAYEIARIQRAYEKWRSVTTDVCRH